MRLEELQQRYGSYVAELVRQALTLDEFERLEVEELLHYFELKAAHMCDAYRLGEKKPHPDQRPTASKDDYLAVLRRRWQQAEEMAQTVRTAEEAYREERARAFGSVA